MPRTTQPGNLDQRVTIQKEVRVSDGAGGSTMSWTDELTVWAEVTPIRGSELVAAGQIQGRALYQIIFRNRTDIDMSVEHRLIWQNQLLNVKSMPLAGPRRPYREIIAESGGPT